MRWLPSLFVVALLAGCSSPPSGDDDPAVEPADFEDLDLVATATTGVIRGIVVDEAIRPVANASVTLTPGDQTVRSTVAGTFGFESLEPGTYFLRVEKIGYNSTQTSTQVVAGVAEPEIVKVLLTSVPGTTPYVEVLTFTAFITCGVAVVVSSVGCNTFAPVGEAIGDSVYFPVEFTAMPMWTQGELVWDQTQAAGGQAIWQIAGCGGYCDGPPAMPSPALSFVSTEVLEDNNESIMDDGVEYRIFGGPHDACTYDHDLTPYGCGVTLNQRFEAYVHNFYNFAPPEGWRFTSDGDPVVPQ